MILEDQFLKIFKTKKELLFYFRGYQNGLADGLDLLKRFITEDKPIKFKDD